MTQNQWDDYSSAFGHDDLIAVLSNRRYPGEGRSGRISFVRAVGLNSDNLAFPKQIHSGYVEIASRPGIVPNTESGTVGLVHTGWRGLVSKILPTAVNSILQIGESLRDFSVLIGPSIQACCFEVRDDVIDQFVPAFYKKNSNNRYTVDLQKWAVHQLADSGITRSRVTVIDKCTFCSQDEYHSYRRNRSNAGRMVAIIGWR